MVACFSKAISNPMCYHNIISYSENNDAGVRVQYVPLFKVSYVTPLVKGVLCDASV